MATNLDKLLWTREDLATFRDISPNIQDAKFEQYIREAQAVECRDFLGAELWLILQEDYDDVAKLFTAPRLQNLWFGTDYVNPAGVTVRFYGYINAGIYFSYSRFLLQQQTNVSRFGVESVQNEISEDISNPQVRLKGRDAQQMAFNYQNDAYTFLTDQPTIYPEYVQAKTQPKRTSFSFFKV